MEITTAGVLAAVAVAGLAPLALVSARRTFDARERVVQPGRTAVTCDGPITYEHAGRAHARGPLGTRHEVTIMADDRGQSIGRGATVVLLEEEGAHWRALGITRGEVEVDEDNEIEMSWREAKASIATLVAKGRLEEARTLAEHAEEKAGIAYVRSEARGIVTVLDALEDNAEDAR